MDTVLCDRLELLVRGVCRYEIIPDEEKIFQEGKELNCPEMACTIGVFIGKRLN